MIIGQKIKELRRKNNMTQERLAELLSISSQAVSRWETDAAMPDISLLIPIANLFGITTDELLGRESGKKAGVLQRFLRNVTFPITTFEGIFFVLCDGERRWGDRFARTEVREKRKSK